MFFTLKKSGGTTNHCQQVTFTKRHYPMQLDADAV